MKNLVALIALIGCMLAPTAFADDDTSVSIEFIWGIGGSTSQKGFALRAGRDNAEVHLAHWFGARSTTVLGVGLVARTEGDGQRANKNFHASGTIGLAYVFQTNSVLDEHLVPYLRVAGGFDVESDGDVELELSYSRYGFESAENFGGIGLRFNDRYEDPTSNTTSHNPEDENPDDDGDDNDGGDDCTENCDGDDDNGDDDNGDDDNGDDDNGDDDSGDDDSGDDDSGDDDSGDDDSGDDDGNNGHGDDDDDDDDDSDSDDDGNNGHGNDEDGCDESNPGNGDNCG